MSNNSTTAAQDEMADLARTHLDEDSIAMRDSVTAILVNETDGVPERRSFSDSHDGESIGVTLTVHEVPVETVDGDVIVYVVRYLDESHDTLDLYPTLISAVHDYENQVKTMAEASSPAMNGLDCGGVHVWTETDVDLYSYFTLEADTSAYADDEEIVETINGPWILHIGDREVPLSSRYGADGLAQLIANALDTDDDAITAIGGETDIEPSNEWMVEVYNR